jgi:hypothetical protein
MTKTTFDNAYEYIAEYSYELYLHNLIETLPDGRIVIWS